MSYFKIDNMRFDSALYFFLFMQQDNLSSWIPDTAMYDIVGIGAQAYFSDSRDLEFILIF